MIDASCSFKTTWILDYTYNFCNIFHMAFYYELEEGTVDFAYFSSGQERISRMEHKLFILDSKSEAAA